MKTYLSDFLRHEDWDTPNPHWDVEFVSKPYVYVGPQGTSFPCPVDVELSYQVQVQDMSLLEEHPLIELLPKATATTEEANVQNFLQACCNLGVAEQDLVCEPEELTKTLARAFMLLERLELRVDKILIPPELETKPFSKTTTTRLWGADILRQGASILLLTSAQNLGSVKYSPWYIVEERLSRKCCIRIEAPESVFKITLET